MTPCGTTDFQFNGAWLRWIGNRCDLVGRTNPCGPKGQMSRTHKVCAHQPTLTVQIHPYCLESSQVRVTWRLPGMSLIFGKAGALGRR